MNGEPVVADVLFAGVAVSDMAAGTAWYEGVLGRPPDIVVNEDEVMWRMADAAWLYVVVDAIRAGRSLVTVAVADLEAVVAGLVGRGVGPGPIEVVPGAGCKAVVTDPDGNALAFVEVNQPA